VEAEAEEGEEEEGEAVECRCSVSIFFGNLYWFLFSICSFAVHLLLMTDGHRLGSSLVVALWGNKIRTCIMRPAGATALDPVRPASSGNR
jgi:hypothetical protein